MRLASLLVVIFTVGRCCAQSDDRRSGGEDLERRSSRREMESKQGPEVITELSTDGGEGVKEVVSEASLVTLVPSEGQLAEARVSGYPHYDDYYDEGPLRRDGYKHKKCHPQTITKYKTVYKERKADVYNKVEVRNPKPQVHKTKETRHTTIRYPVFITQVIKPLLTQVETKVKPMFFTKTLKRIKTIVFTVTGIGQVTVTSVKYEKEYVTRCQKKGYGHDHHGGHDHGYGHKQVHKGYGHRRSDKEAYEPDFIDPEYAYSPPEATHRLRSYEEMYRGRRFPSRSPRKMTELAPSFGGENDKVNLYELTLELPEER